VLGSATSGIDLSKTTTSLAAGPFAGETTGTQTIAGSGPAEERTASDIVASTHISSFIGTGDQSLAVSAIPGTGNITGVGKANVLFFGGAFDSYGTVDIEYTYIPNFAVVPESGRFPLFTACAAALAGLILTVRHVRRPTL
jgi:hypothetical protein